MLGTRQGIYRTAAASPPNACEVLPVPAAPKSIQIFVKPSCLLGLCVEGSKYSKISILQGYLCNISHKELPYFYNQSAIVKLCFSSQSSDSRRLLGGVRVQTATSVYYDGGRN